MIYLADTVGVVPIFTSHSERLAANGALIAVTISLAQADRDARARAGRVLPPPVTATAMIDTGANLTEVRTGLLDGLEMTPVGAARVFTPTDSNVECPVYAIQLTLPHGVVDTTVIETGMRGQQIDMLIGRDVLQECLFIYDGTSGRFTLSF